MFYNIYKYITITLYLLFIIIFSDGYSGQVRLNHRKLIRIRLVNAINNNKLHVTVKYVLTRTSLENYKL